MARLLRMSFPGAWYHVTSRGNERREIYWQDRDRMHFIELFPLWCERFRVRLHAYVLMENHYHLLAQTPEANLSPAMQWLNGTYTGWFNRRHRRVGHLLQGRFGAVVVEPEAWALGLSRYIHLNPVRVHRLGLDKAAQRRRRQGVGEPASAEVIRRRLELLRGFHWSSYRAYAGYEKIPVWLDVQAVLQSGGGSAKDRHRHYRQDCEAAVREDNDEPPWKGVVGRLALGSKDFLRELLEKPSDEQHRQRVAHILAARPSFARVKEVVAELKGQSWGAFRDRHGDWGRDLALYLGRKAGGMKLAALGREVGVVSPMTVSTAILRFARLVGQERSLRKIVGEATRKLQICPNSSSNVE